MERALYEQMENCMLDAMEAGAHDAEHVYRVLYAALDIAQTEPAADLDVVIAACCDKTFSPEPLRFPGEFFIIKSVYCGAPRALRIERGEAHETESCSAAGKRSCAGPRREGV